MNKETLKTIAAKFDLLGNFTATKRVESEAVSKDRTICKPGDKISVTRWHCHMGPTSVKINNRETCIPFVWVMEMGAPKELASYMPFAPKTWKEVLEES